MSKSGCQPDPRQISVCELTAVQSFTQGPRRKWMVKVEGLEKEPRYIELEDPATTKSYSDHDTVLFSSETPSPSPTADEATRQRKVQDYCRSILKQLDLIKAIKERLNTGILQIFINDSIGAWGQPSIHALRWELLEHSSYLEACGCSIQITRIYNSFKYNYCPTSNPPFKTPTRILLVIARSWQLASPSSRGYGHFADISPDVVEATLRETIKACRRRGQPFTVHLAPSGFDRLIKHLEQQERRGIVYDMVHLDLHGRINPDDQEPELLFARPYNSNSTIRPEGDDALDFSASSFEFVKGKRVSEILDRYGIRVVALNSCQSANSQNGNMSNLSHTLFQHNATTVIAMNCAVRGIHAKLFYKEFYRALILDGQSFSSASASGRAYLREHNHNPLERLECDPESIPQIWRCRTSAITNCSRSPVLQHCPASFSVQNSILRFCSSILLWFQPSWIQIPLWLQVPASLIILHHTFCYQLGFFVNYSALWAKASTHLFPDNTVESQEAVTTRSPLPAHKIGIGRMVIENLFKLEDWVSSVYIQLESSPMSDHQQAILKDFIDTWKAFDYVSNETRVSGPQLAPSVWQLICNFVGCSRLQSQTTCLRPRIQGSRFGSHLVIVEDFDYIFRECSTVVRGLALDNLTRLVTDLSNTQPVRVIVIGNADGWDEWRNGGIDPNNHPWVQGECVSAKMALGW